MIPNRPKINDAETDKIAKYFFPKVIPELLVIGVRGYFLNSVGKKNANDTGWDDGIIVYENGTLIKTFNGNTDPSKVNSDLAMLDTGVYQFAKGTHKNRIKAFRAYPEGVRLKCKRQNRNGVWKESLCSAINFHDGGLSDTWSAGCQTIINQGKQKQFDEFRDLVYKLMTKHTLKTFTYLLIEEKEMRAAISGEPTETVSEEVSRDSAAAPAFSPATDSPSDIPSNAGLHSDSPAVVERVNSEVNQNESSPDVPVFGNTLENFGEKVGGFLEEQTGKVEGIVSKTAETVSETIETESGKIEKQTTEITDKFEPKNLPAFIPRFGKQWLLGLIPGGGLLSTIIAKLAALPDWLVFTLGFFTGVTTVLFFQLAIKHREKVLDFITNCYQATANPAMHNLIPTPASEYIGYRRNELFNALSEKK